MSVRHTETLKLKPSILFSVCLRYYIDGINISPGNTELRQGPSFYFYNVTLRSAAQHTLEFLTQFINSITPAHVARPHLFCRS